MSPIPICAIFIADIIIIITINGISQYLHRDGGAGFGVCQGMVMLRKVEAASCGHCLQLMVRKLFSEDPAGSIACAEKTIVRVIHTVHTEYGFQTPFIEPAVMGHQRQPFDKGFSLCPYHGEDRSILRVSGRQPVNPRVPV